MSGLPSPFISPTANSPSGVAPAPSSTGDVNEPALIVPKVEVFRSIAMVLLVSEMLVRRSSLPSPSISAITARAGLGPVAKSTLPANEDPLMIPGVLVFLHTDSEPGGPKPLRFETTRACLPSPSRSPKATPKLSLLAVAKSALPAKDIDPGELWFLKTDTMPFSRMGIAGSGRPSRSTSPAAMI